MSQLTGLPPAEQPFEVHEMFFSTTTAQGVIVHGNDVFSRISGYPAEELCGRPHSVVRHPDMPRGVFQQLWVTLRAGKPFAGYVKNRARDGRFYWVFAVAVPLPDRQLLSIRFKPTTALLGEVAELYAHVSQSETAALRQKGTPREAANVGRQTLTDAITRRGHASYDAFSHAALVAEIKSRDLALERQGGRLFPATLNATATDEDQRERYNHARALYAQMTTLFAGLDAFAAMGRKLRDEAVAVTKVAADFRIASLNTDLAATASGYTSPSVSIIAAFLTNCAGQLRTETGRVCGHLTATDQAVDTIQASISMARLQLEMLLTFQAEVAAHPDAASRPALPQLEQAFVDTTTHARAAIQVLREHLGPITTNCDQLRRTVLSMQMAHVRGLTEAVRLPDAGRVRAMFDEFRTKTAQTSAEIAALATVIDQLTAMVGAMPATLQAAQLRRVPRPEMVAI